MGFHHRNGALLDARLAVERPEMPAYQRLSNGTYRLNGVEYIVPCSAWPETKEPPTVMGQKLKPAPQLPIWHRHVWIWLENPSGLFADWHPHVKCWPPRQDVLMAPPLLRTGRSLYAVAIVGFDTLCLGHVDSVSQLQPVPSWLPGYAPLALLTGAFLIALGVALLVNIQRSLAASALAIVFAAWRNWPRRRYETRNPHLRVP